jgi:hypothetical protein
MDSLPPWSVIEAMLWRVILPGFAVGAGVLAGVGWMTRRPSVWGWGGAAGVIGGLALGNALNGLIPWWSLERGWPSLFPATVLALVGGVVVWQFTPGKPGQASGIGSARSAAGRVLVAAVCAAWLTADGPPLGWVGGFFLLLIGSVAVDAALRGPAVRAFGRGALLVVLAPWGGTAATVLIYAHSARFCDLAVLLTSTVMGLGAAAMSLRSLRPGADTVRPAGGMEIPSQSSVAVGEAIALGPSVFLPALMLGGAANTYSEVPLASFILAALAPVGLGLGRLMPASMRVGRRGMLVAAMLFLAPCVVALALALRAESLDFGQ